LNHRGLARNKKFKNIETQFKKPQAKQKAELIGLMRALFLFFK
tara:strand:+ start:1080 stop:1208 length:129 start_codon:yes stop_codon:yes gene_type:complete